MADEPFDDQFFAEANAHISEIEAKRKRDLQEFGVQHWLKLLESYFQESGNPLLAWSTIRYCNEKNIPLPSWVNDYLSESAARICQIADGDPNKAPGLCLEALGLKRSQGQESPFEDWKRWHLREPACIAFARGILAGAPYKNARTDAATAFNVAPTTLDGWLADFFPGKRANEETWTVFFQRELDVESPRFNVTLSALIKRSQFQ